jgi:hypothetical protein
VGQRGKARQYAMQQKNVAKMLNDETLELLSNVYIAYAHLFEGERQIAQKMIDVTIVLFILFIIYYYFLRNFRNKL